MHDSKEPVKLNLKEFSSTAQLTTRNNNTEDEYNPFEHRVIDKPNTTFGALAHFLKSSLGSGILAMPMAFKNSGLLFGTIATIIVGYFCAHCVHILVRTSHNICRKSKTPSLGYAETAEKVFEMGPLPLRKWSNFAKQFCDFGLVTTYLGANCVYIVFIAATMETIIQENFKNNWNIRIYVAIALIPVLLIGQIQQLKYLVPFSAIANGLIIITFGITIFYIFSEPLVFDDKPLFSSWSALPLYFSTVIFAMEGIGTVMPVANSMIHPERFLGCPGVLNTAMVTVVILYTLLGFFGYVRFGNEVLGSVTLNLPPQYIIAQVAQILMAIAILFTFGLQYYAPIEIVLKKLKDRIPKHRHTKAEALIRIVIILFMGVLAALVPDLSPFIGFVGAVFFSLLGLFVPCVVEAVYLWPNEYGIFKWKLYKNIILAILSLLALIFGAFASILEIIDYYTNESANE